MGPTNRGRRFPAEPLTRAEMESLLRACSNRAPSGVRDRALLTMLWRAGLRCAEALALRLADVDLEAGTSRVLRGKGDKSRLVGLDAGTTATLQRWLDVRKARGLNGRQPLFCTLAGEPLKAAQVRAMLKRRGRRAGIEKRVHPHGLRHTHAFELAAEGTPLVVISAQLGHSNAATTSRYIQHLAPKQVIDAMRAREWNPPA